MPASASKASSIRSIYFTVKFMPVRLIIRFKLASFLKKYQVENEHRISLGEGGVGGGVLTYAVQYLY